jgi:hypothetical protein
MGAVNRAPWSSLSSVPLLRLRRHVCLRHRSAPGRQAPRAESRNGPSWSSSCSSSSVPSSPVLHLLVLGWRGWSSVCSWDSSIPLVRNLTCCLYESFQSETNPDFLGRRNSLRVGTLIYQIDLQQSGFDNRNEFGCLHVKVVSFHILSPYM